MDLQVAIIILIVFLVSFMSYLFISKFLPHGKTFDEMIAEKKRMREEMLGTMKPTTVKTFKVIPGNKKKPQPPKKVIYSIWLSYIGRKLNNCISQKVTIQKSDSQKSNQSESEEDIEMIEQQLLQEAQKVVANKRKVNKKVKKKEFMCEKKSNYKKIKKIHRKHRQKKNPPSRKIMKKLWNKKLPLLLLLRPWLKKNLFNQSP